MCIYIIVIIESSSAPSLSHIMCSTCCFFQTIGINIHEWHCIVYTLTHLPVHCIYCVHHCAECVRLDQGGHSWKTSMLIVLKFDLSQYSKHCDWLRICLKPKLNIFENCSPCDNLRPFPFPSCMIRNIMNYRRCKNEISKQFLHKWVNNIICETWAEEFILNETVTTSNEVMINLWIKSEIISTKEHILHHWKQTPVFE